MNQLKTIVLLGALSALLVAIGGAIGGNATWFFLALALAMNLGAYFFSDTIVNTIPRDGKIDANEAGFLRASMDADQTYSPAEKRLASKLATSGAEMTTEFMAYLTGIASVTS